MRSVLSLSAKPGRSDDVESYYREHAILVRATAFDGCLDAQLFRTGGTDTGVTHMVMADWESATDYQNWVDDPWRNEIGTGLLEILERNEDSVLMGGLYALVLPDVPADSLRTRRQAP